MCENINIVKIGSDSINEQNLRKIIDDAKKWEKQTGEKFIFISSWAVKLWKQRIEGAWKNIEHFSKSSLASIWQQFLMKMYDDFSGKEKLVWEVLLDDYVNAEYVQAVWIEWEGIIVGLKQILRRVADILSKKKDQKLQELLIENIKNDVWSILNHNDALSNEELNNLSDRTDNDKNTVYISGLLKDTNLHIKRVIYLTNTNWLLNKEKNTVLGWKIKSEEDKNYYKKFVEENKSNSWTGWMKSKLDCGFKVLEYGVGEVIISNAKNWLKCFEENRQCTKFF